MLNELSTLARSLEVRNIHTDSWHPDIKPFRKGAAIVVALDAESRIAYLTDMSKEQVAEIRNIAPDNQKSFPGFNFKSPIYKLDPSCDPGTFWALITDRSFHQKSTQARRV